METYFRYALDQVVSYLGLLVIADVNVLVGATPQPDLLLDDLVHVLDSCRFVIVEG